jgi:hypothetical protein
MRTTLAIDDDVLAAARAIADQKGRSVGDVVSELCRRALLPPPLPGSTVRNGITLFPLRPDAKPVTLELVRRLSEDCP